MAGQERSTFQTVTNVLALSGTFFVFLGYLRELGFVQELDVRLMELFTVTDYVTTAIASLGVGLLIVAILAMLWTVLYLVAARFDDAFAAKVLRHYHALFIRDAPLDESFDPLRTMVVRVFLWALVTVLVLWLIIAGSLWIGHQAMFGGVRTYAASLYKYLVSQDGLRRTFMFLNALPLAAYGAMVVSAMKDGRTRRVLAVATVLIVGGFAIWFSGIEDAAGLTARDAPNAEVVRKGSVEGGASRANNVEGVVLLESLSSGLLIMHVAPPRRLEYVRNEDIVAVRYLPDDG